MMMIFGVHNKRKGPANSILYLYPFILYKICENRVVLLSANLYLQKLLDRFSIEIISMNSSRIRGYFKYFFNPYIIGFYKEYLIWISFWSTTIYIYILFLNWWLSLIILLYVLEIWQVLCLGYWMFYVFIQKALYIYLYYYIIFVYFNFYCSLKYILWKYSLEWSQ